MKVWLRYTLYTLLWIGVVAYIIFATYSVRAYRSALIVDSVEIEIVDSSAISNLISRSMVEGWIKKSGIKTKGQRADSLQLTSLERYIANSGFVDKVKCYITHSGVVRVEVSQLRPVLRVLFDGYNSYVTAEGYVFQLPVASSRYVPVVTGSYSPLFAAGYSGSLEELYRAKCEEIDGEIKRIEKRDLYPLYTKRNELRAELKVVNSRYTRRRFGESAKECDERVAELKDRNSRDRARISRELHLVALEIDRVVSRQKVYSERQKKFEKKYQDLINLITFVNVIENDRFWSSEIVQIDAKSSTNGDLLLELIPRSGDHTIIFGEVVDVVDRLDNAKVFYKEVLPNIGWHEFKSISVEFKSQIVCK